MGAVPYSRGSGVPDCFRASRADRVRLDFARSKRSMSFARACFAVPRFPYLTRVPARVHGAHDISEVPRAQRGKREAGVIPARSRHCDG